MVCIMGFPIGGKTINFPQTMSKSAPKEKMSDFLNRYRGRPKKRVSYDEYREKKRK